MTGWVLMAEAARGPFVESQHFGAAAIAGPEGIREAWGDAGRVILPRSAIKMIQALPLVTSGAADAARLGPEHLALACASHQGAEMHTRRVADWLDALGLSEADLRCGPQMPSDRAAREALIRAKETPTQLHNNCSGKHAGMLTLARHLGAGPEYHLPGHPVQIACREVFEALTGAPSPGYGIDGCALPNFAGRLDGIARAMAWFATAHEREDARSRAAVRLTEAMMAHPELVAGEGRTCTELMRAAPGAIAVKTGAEGVFTAILPEQGLGVALKIADGAARAADCAIAALLVRLGALDAKDPAVRRRMEAAVLNRRGDEVGAIRPATALG
ncbi:asparaginase [Rhodosalinus halophilus]|uniref:Asparaginase n=1 Tax=Rhodosalinus halophilus TaxID=2259333 RepID=A0A365UAR5_9RHOB|nr:asparaginase [Rhodosalinus halophilus]RBI85538.1 asparaginase [Rhodosalinus halophilus]